MKVVLAEKPSVARDIARFLGAHHRRDGYLEGQGWAVTWAFGHLLELQMPDQYDPAWKRWRLETLPMVPEHFRLQARGDAGARKQLSIVKGLLQGASEIVCATDAGREGELIFRYIQTWCRCKSKPFQRLWISSLTQQAIAQGFANLTDGRRFDSLYHAARCRSEADWIVGINATRFFTVSYGGGQNLWSVGRVQTPILALIVERDLEIAHFVPEDFWEVHTVYRETTFKHQAGRFKEKPKAEAVLGAIRGRPLTITGVQEKKQTIHPPQLYDLTALQKDMNKRYGMTAKRTLQAAQNLYERKHITYPRTDSRYLEKGLTGQLPGLLDALRRIKPQEIAPLDLGSLPITGRIVNDAKVSDHHAIIPTPEIPGGLSGDEARVYEAIVIRFIAVFYPPCIKGVTTVSALTNKEPFRATGTVMLEPGWQTLYPYLLRAKKPAKGNAPAAAGQKGAPEQAMPAFQIDESGPHQPEVKTMKTSPPKPYNEATLLHTMETAGRRVDEEELREALKGKGIGTPATRAAIIETLLDRGYIERAQKKLTSTASGRHLISLVRDARLKSPELTGDWEMNLHKIERGEYSPEQFMAEVRQYTEEILHQGRAAPLPADGTLGKCPLCGAGVIQGKKGYGCSRWREGCGFVVWRESLGVALSPEMIAELLEHGSLLHALPLTLEDGRSVRGRPVLRKGVLGWEEIPEAGNRSGRGGKSGKSGGRGKKKGGDYPTEPLGVCPLCQGEVIESVKAYGCAKWREGCKFTIWKKTAGKQITRAMATRLLTKGTTGVLQGFHSKAGKTFAAELCLVNGEVKMNFGPTEPPPPPEG